MSVPMFGRRVFDIAGRKRRFYTLKRWSLRLRATLTPKRTVDLRAPHRRYAVPIAVVGLLLIAFFATRQLLTKAEVADFFPATCLGTWQHIQNAQGEPEVVVSADSSLFTTENSALYEGGDAAVFCGGFVPSDFEPAGTLERVGITLVWDIEGFERAPIPPLPQTDVPDKNGGEALPESAGETEGETVTTKEQPNAEEPAIPAPLEIDTSSEDPQSEGGAAGEPALPEVLGENTEADAPEGTETNVETGPATNTDAGTTAGGGAAEEAPPEVPVGPVETSPEPATGETSSQPMPTDTEPIDKTTPPAVGEKPAASLWHAWWEHALLRLFADYAIAQGGGVTSTEPEQVPPELVEPALPSGLSGDAATATSIVPAAPASPDEVSTPETSGETSTVPALTQQETSTLPIGESSKIEGPATVLLEENVTVEQEATSIPPDENIEPEAGTENIESAEGTSTTEPIEISPPIAAPLEPVEEEPADSAAEGVTAGTSTVSETIPLPDVTPPPPEPDERFLKVSYSIDGNSWFEVARIGEDNWENFTARVPINSWDDLRRLQVSIEGIPTSRETSPRVLLAGMLVEAHYELPPVFGEETTKEADADASQFPIIELPAHQKPVPLDVPAETFRAGEAPSFIFDLDALSPSRPATSSSPTPAALPPETAPSTTSTSTTSTSPPAAFPPKPTSLPKEEEVQEQPVSLLDRFLGAIGIRQLGNAHAQVVPQKEDPSPYSRIPPVVPTPGNSVTAQIIGPGGTATDSQPVFLTIGNKLHITVPEPRGSVMPGKYRLNLWVLENGVIYHTSSEFFWGVIAVNVNKSVYTAGDLAKMGFGVVDDHGHTVCNATVDTSVLFPSGQTLALSTQDGSIRRSSECGPTTVTNTPDYQASFPVTETGIYQVSVTAETPDGTRTVSDNFTVESQPAFEVERVGPTRIYPPATYRMVLRITAREAATVIISEVVPPSFVVSASAARELQRREDIQLIRWTADLQSGEQRELSYTFDAPDISPMLHKLGPLAITGLATSAGQRWQESRQWQVAADAVSNNGVLGHGETAADDNMQFHNYTTPSTWVDRGNSVDVTTETNDIFHVVLKTAPTRDEIMGGQFKSGGLFNVIRCVDNCDASTDWSEELEITGVSLTCDTVDGGCQRKFDIAYEQLSGRAFVAYGTATNGVLYYNIWDGASWAGEASTTFRSSSSYDTRWVRLVADGEGLAERRSNRLIAIVADANQSIFANIWDGSSFGTWETIDSTGGTGAKQTQCFDGAWETLSGDAVVAYCNGDSDTTPLSYKKWNQSSWDATGSNVVTFGATGYGKWVELRSDPHSDRVAGAFLKNGNDATWAIWKQDGSTEGWTEGTEDDSITDDRNKGVSVAWEHYNSGTPFALFVKGDAATFGGDKSDYETWTSGTGFSGKTDMPGAAGDKASVWKLYGAPNSDEIMAVLIDRDQDLCTQRWSGSAWEADCSAERSTTIPPNINNSQGETNADDFTYRMYSPWSRNWRFYGDETANDPSVGLNGAGENATTTAAQEEFIRLRMQFVELANTGQTDARKKLQWTTDDPDSATSTWNDVGDTGETTSTWRYATSAETCTSCSDNTAIASSTLTGTTQNGTYISDKDAAAGTNMDHTASSTVEYDYPLKAENVTSGITYYFRAYDVDQQTPVFRRQDSGTTDCLGSACTYPSLTITAAGSPPTVSAVVLNGGSSITLIPNATTSITAVASTTDPDGAGDISSATSTIYRSGVGASCAADNLNCYQISSGGCSFADSTSTVSCTADIYYFAQATDASSSFSGQDWQADITVTDSTSNTGTSSTVTGVELNSLLAISLATTTLNYGSVAIGTNTGATNQISTTTNAGNTSSTLRISGTAFVSSTLSLPTSSQHYATSSFTFGGSEQQLQESATDVSGSLLTSPTSTTNVAGNIFWGVEVPSTSTPASYQSTITYTAVFSP